jgi:hypothetical protein
MSVELLSNFDIIELCKMFNIKLISCVSKDLLKTIKQQDGSYVINLDDSDSSKGGTHWVALVINKNNACYFDPFGILPPTEIKYFCKNKMLTFSKDQIQNEKQSSCGYYCLAFLHYMTIHIKQNISIKTILNVFLKPFDLDNTPKNDNILQKYLKTNMNIK